MISTCGPYGYKGDLFEFFRPDSTTHPLAPVGNFLASLRDLSDDHARNLLGCVADRDCTRIRAFYASNHDDLFALIERVHGS